MSNHHAFSRSSQYIMEKILYKESNAKKDTNQAMRKGISCSLMYLVRFISVIYTITPSKKYCECRKSYHLDGDGQMYNKSRLGFYYRLRTAMENTSCGTHLSLGSWNSRQSHCNASEAD